MITNEDFMHVQMDSYRENICTPSVPNGVDRYIKIALPTVVHSYAGKMYQCRWKSAPHLMPLCMRYCVNYSHVLEELTFALQDESTGQIFTGKFVDDDPSPRNYNEITPLADDTSYPPHSYILQMPRQFVCSFNVAQYVNFPRYSAIYTVQANSGDIVSNLCRVELVWHER